MNALDMINNILLTFTKFLSNGYVMAFIIYLMFEMSLVMKKKKLLIKRLYDNSKIVYKKMEAFRERFHKKHPSIRKKLDEEGPQSSEDFEESEDYD